MNFLTKRSEVEKNVFDPFYREIGFEHGELRQLLTALISRVEEERDATGHLNEKDRAFLDKLSDAKKDLEQLKIDIDVITNIDSAIDEAMSALHEKIGEAQKFEHAAWDEFDAIAQELSDTKAYERFFIIDNIHTNLKELYKYINNEFAQYFEGLIKAAHEKTERVKKEIKNLQDKDIDLKEQAELMVESENEQEQDQAAQLAAQEAKRAQELAKTGFFTRLWMWIVSFFTSIWCWILKFLKWLWNIIFGWWLYRLK